MATLRKVSESLNDTTSSVESLVRLNKIRKKNLSNGALATKDRSLLKDRITEG